MSAAIEAVAERFWRDARAAGVSTALPRDVRAAAGATLSVAFFDAAPLTVGVVRERLARCGRRVETRGDDATCLRGCLYAEQDRAFVFVRADDSEEQRRLTVAHEIAHLLLHHLAPRAGMLAALGPGAAAVLDGRRAATDAERAFAALHGARLGPHVHLFGAARGEDDAEGEADDLAVELLAPTVLLREHAGDADARWAALRFGLPADVVEARLRALRPRRPDAFVAWAGRQLEGAAR